MLTSAGFWVFVLIVFLVVDGIAGLYVRTKHGADMVRSDYHRALTLLWTLRALTGCFLVGFVVCFMVFTVLINGDFAFFFGAVGRMLGLAWELVALVVSAFFRILFR